MQYVIIGGDAAGMSAAMQIIRHDQHAKVITLEKGNIYSYSQCGLPYLIGQDITSSSKLIARSIDTFRNKYGIDARCGYEVTEIDAEAKQVKGKTVEHHKPFSISYDKLLIATGADPVFPDWSGKHFKGIYTLKTISDAEKMIKGLSRDVQHAVIIGGGYIGLEVAEAFYKRKLKVTMIDRGSRLIKVFDSDMSELIHEEAANKGIKIILNEEVQEFKGDEFVQAVETDKGSYKADIAVAAAGIAPNTSFLEHTPVELGIKNAIKVNEYMETSAENIYAAGDCALQYHRLKKAYDYIPLGTNANKMGRIAGMNMIGERRPFAGITGTSIIKFIDLELGRSGLTEEDAAKLGYDFEAVKIKSTDIAGYFPGKTPLWVKLIAEKGTKKLLGGQVIGRNGAAKRTDVIAAALYSGLTITDLENLDLSYAPPFNSVWDPIQQAARRFK
ncbi:NADPH-dependent 2,4-dienoyl-CoA reductase/sulfur reductase-like enzyme [Scopulibacillus daqui]|uniref:NADPH-dependent 2,4-dienoyl-CoA reductase/sulfur reductase-like enzyme n=1 Tax=Scopulibacillus daqui TaxID=1469162 RepID=A0ABS2Q122_9BACL|nr:FAD-dependent oxidoreductase [Scopulibacillus daqui]MBM7645379.1 NADPH-dependent 2,4-dienoyl-CoA reductase/sulfur reductase-like enzyme [Scopulibacillus daqui]